MPSLRDMMLQKQKEEVVGQSAIEPAISQVEMSQVMESDPLLDDPVSEIIPKGASNKGVTTSDAAMGIRECPKCHQRVMNAWYHRHDADCHAIETTTNPIMKLANVPELKNVLAQSVAPNGGSPSPLNATTAKSDGRRDHQISSAIEKPHDSTVARADGKASNAQKTKVQSAAPIVLGTSPDNGTPFSRVGDGPEAGTATDANDEYTIKISIPRAMLREIAAILTREKES